MNFQTISRLALLSLTLSVAVMGSGCVSPASHSPEPVAAAAQPSGTLLPFASDEGLARLARTPARADFAALSNQFEAQSNSIFCGPTTAAIVLNAIAPNDPGARDRSRLKAEDLRWLSQGADISVPRHTQESVIAKGAKTRAQVLGEPMLVNGKEIKDFGYQLKQFDEMLRAHGAKTRAVVVTEQKPDADIRADLIGNLQRAGDYALVNYQRTAVGQKGGGHISPLAAYDAASDSVLVLDVNPAAAGWVWMPMATLIKGMRSFDTVENRGYVLVFP